MDANRLNIIEAHCLDHKFDVKELIAEVRLLSAENASLRAKHDVTDTRIDKVLAEVQDEIEDEAIEYIFGTYGQPAELAHNAFTAGANLGLEIAARIVQYGE